MVRDLSLVLGAFFGATALASAAGAANLGTAATFGQLAFTAALMFVIVKR